METTAYEYYMVIIIPSLIGIAASLFYAMLFSKKKFKPHKIYDENGQVRAYYMGWIGHIFAGIIGGLLLSSLVGMVKEDLILVIVSSIIGGILSSKYIEGNWPNRNDHVE